MGGSSSSEAEAGWVKLALLLAFFGLQAFIYALIAQDKKPLPGRGSMAGNGYVMCEFPRASVAMGSLSVLSLLLAIIAGHAAVLYKPSPLAVPRRALFRSAILLVFFLVAEMVSASAVAMLVGATMADHDSLRYYYQLPEEGGWISCPPKAPDGCFGGGALLALDATLMWFVCQLLALEARANYLDRLPQDDDDHDKKTKKKGDDAHGDQHQATLELIAG